MKHLFPILILCLYSGAVVSYVIQRDFGRALYWLFAAGITVSATWLVR